MDAWPLAATRAQWPPPATDWLRCDFCRAVLPDPILGRDYEEVGVCYICKGCVVGMNGVQA